MELREEVAREICEYQTADQFDGLPEGMAKEYWRTSADAAIAIVLRKVEQHLSAVQYDPAPYTALKHRLAGLASKPDQETEMQHWSDCAVHNEPYSEAGPCDCGGVGVDMRRAKSLDDLLPPPPHKEPNQ